MQPSLGYGIIDQSSEQLRTEKQFDEWIGSMADLGARELILQWSVHYEENQHWFSESYGGAPSADFALFPITPKEINGVPSRSWGEGNSISGSSLIFMLNGCAENRMNLRIGLYLNESAESFNWWDAVNDQHFSSRDSLIIEHHVQRSIAAVDDLARLYGDHHAFTGVYISFEIANHAFIPDKNQSYLISIFDRITDRVHEKLPGKSVAVSPFFNIELSTPEEFGSMWENVLSKTAIDLVILQDGVGVEPKSLTLLRDRVTPFFKAVRRAAEKSNTEFRINCELFTNRGSREKPDLVPGKTSSIKRQLNRAAKQCDTIAAFDFRYMDPNCDHAETEEECKSRKALYRSYRHYLNRIAK